MIQLYFVLFYMIDNTFIIEESNGMQPILFKIFKSNY